MLLGYIITLNKKSWDKKLYKFELLILWLLLALRYGQGSDYFSYMRIFYSMNSLRQVIYNPQNIHGEIGFRFLCYIIGDNYQYFIILLSIFTIIMFQRFVEKYSSNYCLSILLSYPVFYLSYAFSSFRQIIVLSIFMGIMLELLLKKKYKKYIVWCLILSLFHNSALVLLLMPFLIKISLKNISILSGIMIVCLLAVYNMGENIISKIPLIGFKMSYYYNNDMSLFALLERILTLIMLVMLYVTNSQKTSTASALLKLYIGGIVLYVGLSQSALIASRVVIYFKVLEIVLFPLLLERKSLLRQVVILYLLILIPFMTYKNLSSYAEQGKYKENITAWNYPYISIFNKEEIWDYREKPVYWSSISSITKQKGN